MYSSQIITMLITITADTYAHLDMSSKVTSAEKISDSLAALAT